MLANNRWIRASGTLNEKPISIQYREDWQLIQETADYTICTQIAWQARTLDDSTGFPSLAEQVDILAFGERLQKSVESQENALIMMVLTHAGVNQWVIYCRDFEALKNALDNVIEDEQQYPLEIVADEDSSWSTFNQVRHVIH